MWAAMRPIFGIEFCNRICVCEKGVSLCAYGMVLCLRKSTRQRPAQCIEALL